ncbi:MAG TPA: hypothetical protein DCW97_06395, partial [Acidobacteria bacterium]|nr:hypothetical protein [Acidobacteriota bacterium]
MKKIVNSEHREDLNNGETPSHHPARRLIALMETKARARDRARDKARSWPGANKISPALGSQPDLNPYLTPSTPGTPSLSSSTKAARPEFPPRPFLTPGQKKISSFLLFGLLSFFIFFNFNLLMLSASPLPAADNKATRPPDIDKEALKKAQEEKVARAVRLVNTSVKLDGLLEEEIWKKNQPVSDFLQRDPLDGAPATELTEVWVAYDD